MRVDAVPGRQPRLRAMTSPTGEKDRVLDGKCANTSRSSIKRARWRADPLSRGEGRSARNPLARRTALIWWTIASAAVGLAAEAATGDRKLASRAVTHDKTSALERRSKMNLSLLAYGVS